MRLLDKYVLNSFLIPFLLCFLGFLSIWLVFDLGGNLQDFLEARTSVRFVAYFYLTQLPQVTIVCLPVGLLLALLYSLSKMSRSNEIIAMLTAGQSVVRVMVPLILASMVLTGVSTLLNYKLAPHADSIKKQLFAEIGRRRDKDTSIQGQVFRNRMDARTWYVLQMPSKPDNRAVLYGLHIMEQNPEGIVKAKWYARSARFTEATKTWTLTGGKTVRFDANGDVQSEAPFQTLEITGWSENPWRIASSSFEAQSLSVPELRAYLRYNADFPDTALAVYRTHLQNRWALPWQCLVVVFLAAPLGIVYSRRGVLSGVAGAIFFFAFMTFSNSLMMALGKGSRLSPAVAAWSPTVLFLLIGFYLLYLKSTNRELPKFSLFRSR